MLCLRVESLRMYQSHLLLGYRDRDVVLLSKTFLALYFKSNIYIIFHLLQTACHSISHQLRQLELLLHQS